MTVSPHVALRDSLTPQNNNNNNVKPRLKRAHLGAFRRERLYGNNNGRLEEDIDGEGAPPLLLYSSTNKLLTCVRA